MSIFWDRQHRPRTDWPARSLREAGVEPLGLDTYLSASFAAAMAREGVGLAFTYRSCRIMRDEFRYLRIGKDGIFLDLGARLARWKIPLAGGDGAREAVSGDGAGAAEAVSFFTPTPPAVPQRKYPSRHVSAVFHELHRAALQYI